MCRIRLGICFEVLKENNVSVQDMTIIGGGSKSGVWKEMLNGVFNLPVKKSNCSDCAALGAAILAGVAVEIYESIDSACENIVRHSDLIKDDNFEEYDKLYRVYKKLYSSLQTDFRDLSRI